MSSQKRSLIIFTRYPEPGKTKTRLIRAIGAEEAAQIQRQMTEKTLVTASKLQQSFNLEINIYFNGGSLDSMKQWLGSQYRYQPQGEGDLGNKMYAAFDDSFSRGSQQVVIIGIDCPQLSNDILQQAFLSLEDHDLVVGPADDGGYYLLGLKNLKPDFFKNIQWGSEQVYDQTVAIAEKLRYKIYKLPVLRDIDRPEDLKFWHNET